MKISDKQVLELISFAQTLSEVLYRHFQADDADYVRNLLKEIASQQSDEPVERNISKCQHQFVKVYENPFEIGKIYWQCLHCEDRKDD